MTSRQKKLEFEAFVRKMAPKEYTVGTGKPGRRFRRRFLIDQTSGTDGLKTIARSTPEGIVWLARKAAGR